MIKILKDSLISIPTISSLVLVIISIILSFTYLSFPLDVSLIIKFEALRGIKSFGSIINISLTILIVLLYILTNTFLAWYLYSKKKLISYLLTFSSFFISLLLLIYIGVIIGIN
ncbi:MAG: hypothetical protein COV57_02340 [Candidatus Liptonbacteria bacterium CG11_big_fil_rev_8_21_14_0_20_35_14]|uniref:Uncharacterized protein n=1 Tax=Candidatus Liptonbacteria bacterium CG11_big_fil_rev_8_21_14_0_20_35_14 TaxID=1974634 RepID=A0A2H0N7K6_9BACT|nr:MAG: hypothetical protein COV57_02340 [Candidatus Liptonbacteria bacterium CG11_big_fil_rev_8_21_14_0_20_35_14]